jgi:replicative DNA helicase
MFDEEVDLIDTQPHSVKAEEAVLGSIIVNPESIKLLSLSPDDFYIVRNGWIYAAMLSLSREHKKLDILTISEYLNSTDQLEDVGGSAYIYGLVNCSPSSLHVEGYAEIVQNLSRRRSIISIFNDGAKKAYDKSANIDLMISDTISRLANKANIQNGAVHISEYISKVYDIVSDKHDHPVKLGEVSGIPSGFIDFDNYTDGFHKGEETILTAEPGLGKSLLAFQMAVNMAMKGYPGVVYELEMSGSAVAKRTLSWMTGTPTRDMDRGTMNDWQPFVGAVEKLEKLPLYMSEDTRLTTATLRADLARLREDKDIQWFVLDYLSLLKDNKGKDDIERTAWLSSELHGICKDLRLAGLVIHSMNKQGVRENNGSQADLAGSVRVIYDADQIIVMQKDKTIDNQVNLYWSKFREGQIPKSGVQLIKRAGLPAFADKY